MFNRPTGVTIPKGQINAGLENGPPNTIGNIVEAKQYAVQWFDETGKQHVDVWFKAGNVWYKPPQSEEWASQLGPVKDVFVKQAESMIGIQAAPADAPTKDAVDVVAESVAASPAIPPANVDV